jgi:hypothetical protein
MDDIRRPKRRPITGVLKQAQVEPIFITPEDMAEKDIQPEAPEPTNQMVPKRKRLNFSQFKFKMHIPHCKKQWIIVSSIAVLLLGGSGASAYWFVIRKPIMPVAVVAPVIVKKVIPPPPTTEISKLSGREVPIGTNLGPVTAIQIENSPDARPQAGLLDASIVYEAIAEGGITRFNAVYQDTAPEYIGPVRSLRPYYIDWFWPFDASIAHVGGAPQALADVKSLGIKDMDQFFNSGPYDRISSRYAPHNVYTSIARLNELEKAKGFTSANYTGWTRKKEAKIAVPTASTINLAISSYYYNVSYAYNAADNAYMRSEAEQPHKDDKSGKQLEPKVVVAISMGRGIAGDGQHTEYTTTGSGHMYVFQDGGVQEGTWSKESRQAQWVFTDAAGKALAFNPGQTWLTMVDSNTDVTYTP